MDNGRVRNACARVMIEIHFAVVNAARAGAITYQIRFITMRVEFSPFSYRNYYTND